VVVAASGPVATGAVALPAGAVAVVVGAGAVAVGAGAVTAGTGAAAVGAGAVAVDVGAVALDGGAVAVEAGTEAEGAGAVAVGSGAIAFGAGVAAGGGDAAAGGGNVGAGIRTGGPALGAFWAIKPCIGKHTTNAAAAIFLGESICISTSSTVLHRERVKPGKNPSASLMILHQPVLRHQLYRSPKRPFDATEPRRLLVNNAAVLLDQTFVKATEAAWGKARWPEIHDRS
jgi:hypothetical protein